MSTHPVRRRRIRVAQAPGFSLIELLLAVGLGISLSGMIVQLLISESHLGLRVNRLLRERSVQQRTLALIQDDVQRSSRVSATPQLEQHACSLAGRLPVLHLSTTTGPITYSVGARPSAIWRGQVLMRCGPAFDLAGQVSFGSAAQNRVVMDALATGTQTWSGCKTLLGNGESFVDLANSSQHAFSACIDRGGTTGEVRLLQEFPNPDKNRRPQYVMNSRIISTYS